MGTTTKPKIRGNKPHRQIFDADTFDMIIDSGCSYCITNSMDHFVETPEEANVAVKGIGGQIIRATKKSTVRWSFANDDGQMHDEFIQNTYYNAGCPYCLYSPQHIAQQANDHYPKPNGTYSITYSNHMELFWDQATQKRTVPIHPKLNVFMMSSAPAQHTFTAFCAKIEQIDDYHLDMKSKSIQAYYNSYIVSDGESDNETEGEDDDESKTGCNNQEREIRKHPDLPNSVFTEISTELRTKSQNELHVIPVEDTEVQASTTQEKLLAWHYRLGHLPFGKIQQLAKRGDTNSISNM